jgi:hypothetical protein
MSALRARCQDARVYSSILNNKRREKMIVCHLWVCGLWGMWAHTLQKYDILLQILFQEMKIGHL